MTKGKVVQFRRGRHTIQEKHFLIQIDGVIKKNDAEKFIGKEVTWKSPSGKIIAGKISGTHGIKGIVRAIFERGLPGQAVTTEVNILTSEIKNDKSSSQDTKREIK
ncbi:MAG: 50S ribosomal protein L35ae [Nanoarchaeota archaeon]